MNVILTSRHIELGDDVKSYAEKKLRKSETFFDHIIEAHMVLSAEKHRRIAEVTLNAKHATFHATEVSEDMYSSIDGVMEKIDSQIKRYKEKLKDNRHRAKDLISEEEEVEEEDLASKAYETPQITKVKKFASKPMTTQEALMQLDASDDEFLMFSNSQTDRINVIYKRKDGSYGLIEPDFE